MVIVKKQNKIIYLPYIILIFCLLLSAPLFFLRGIGVFDDSVFLKIGELILEGIVPYRDVFDNKPPGIYYLAAGIAAVSNSHWLAPRIFLFVFAGLFGIWVIEYTRKYWGNIAACLVSAIFGLSYTIAQGYSFHTDEFCAFFGFAAIVTVSGERRKVQSSWFKSGFLIGIALLFKQVAVLYLVAIILSQMFESISKGLSQRALLNRCMILIFGFSILPVILVAVILCNGIWSDFYDAVFSSTLPVAQKSVNLSNTLNLWLKVPAIWLVIPSFFILLLDRQVRRFFRYSAYFTELVFLTSSGILSIFPTLNQFSNTHYTGTSLVFLAISNSVILSYWLIQKRNRIFSKTAYTFLCTCIFIIYLASIIWGGSVMILQNRLAVDLAQMHEIRNFLNIYLPLNEPILSLSDNPARIYYMSGRRPFIKYIYYYGSGWLNKKIPTIDASTKLLLTDKVPGAILETSLNSFSNNTKQIKGYQVIEMPNSINKIYQTRTTILIRKDLYSHKAS